MKVLQVNIRSASTLVFQINTTNDAVNGVETATKSDENTAGKH